ncbi:death-associated inhibitor of apoptosis 1-like [Chrysoperla carnea]|uniref:death-associated inhibitor of apoptosis 1-like n=1 Tax=Chrysoperla carnea TaxID=189513 RepID=UPI001D077E3D|nr:death-associated inhibitor of apoptosis 1-like [Chrysoperla carnea]
MVVISINKALSSFSDDDESIKIIKRPQIKYPEHVTLESRLRTYKSWNHPIKVEELAAARFFYVGFEDRTKCFYCGLGLYCWAVNDIAWEQHARWYSPCAYVRINKGDEFIQDVCSRIKLWLNKEDAIKLLQYDIKKDKN